MSTLHLITHTEPRKKKKCWPWPKSRGEEEDLFLIQSFFLYLQLLCSPTFFHTAVQKRESFIAEGGEWGLQFLVISANTTASTRRAITAHWQKTLSTSPSAPHGKKRLVKVDKKALSEQQPGNVFFFFFLISQTQWKANIYIYFLVVASVL